MNQQSTILELNEATKAYDNFMLSVSLKVNSGELVSLLGPSGSGKTTTLKVIAGFESVDTGSIVYDGREISRQKPWNRGFGYVPQDLVLFPHLDVGGNIAYGLKTRRLPKEYIRKKVEELLYFVGLSGFRSRKIETLSGGERQRVALARAVAIEPGLLLLDEPFSALDAPLRREMRDEVRRITRELGISALFVTHNQDEGLSISDNVAIMNEGIVVQQDTPETVFEKPRNTFVAEFIGSANVLPVTVECKVGDFLSLYSGGRRLLVDGRGNGALTRGATPQLVVRPHNFTFCSADGDNSIPVRIVSRRFLGDRYEYICANGDTRYSVVEGERLETSRDIHICFDPEDGYLLA
jgi:ABC-type Fe3+/spermidine/putrescine transport system ATPase subunit